MAKYKYKAVTDKGEQVKGTVEAIDAGAARATLIGRGLEEPEVKEKASGLKFEVRRVPREDVMHLSRQLAAFIRAGIPLVDGLLVISEETANKRLKRVLEQIAEGLRSGQTFSAAVAAHPDIFPRIYPVTLRSAELTGELDTVLDQMSIYIQRDMEVKRQIRSAMIYPAIIGLMALVTIIILTTFVLPRFVSFFRTLGAELPLPTRILLNATGFLGVWWWAVTGGLIVVGLASYAFFKTQAGRRFRDRLILRLPALGEVARYAAMERLSRMLASMVEAGVPLPDAILIAGEGTNNTVYTNALTDVHSAMLKGEGLSRPMVATRLFPGVLTQMVRVGEDTGTLDQQLGVAAAYFEQELGYKTKRLTTLFEPAVIVTMGLIVGFVAVALVSAMYGIFRQAGQI